MCVSGLLLTGTQIGLTCISLVLCRQAVFVYAFQGQWLGGRACALVQFCFVCALAGRSCWCARHSFLLPGRRFSQIVRSCFVCMLLLVFFKFLNPWIDGVARCSFVLCVLR